MMLFLKSKLSSRFIIINNLRRCIDISALLRTSVRSFTLILAFAK